MSYLLFLSHFLSTWGQRMWEFGAIIFPMEVYKDSLLPISLYGLVINISGLLLGPTIGHLIDKHNRLLIVRAALFFQNVSIVAASGTLFILLFFQDQYDEYRDYIYLGTIIFGTTGQLATTCRDISIEKDWVVVISQTNESLDYFNSRMRRIDLFCKLVAPVIVGLTSTFISSSVAVSIIGCWSLVSFFFEFVVLTLVYKRFPQLHEPKERQLQSSQPQKLNQIFKRQLNSWKLYFNHSVFLASFAYTFLYATVVDIGSQHTSYLKWAGISDANLAIVRGVSAGVGIIATLTYPSMSKKIGLERTGLWSIWLQFIFVAPCAVVLGLPNTTLQTSSWITLALACFSRFGLWSFDLCEIEILQQRVSNDISGEINGVQSSVINIMNISQYAITIIFSDPEMFLWPTVFSCIMVLSAATIYTSWVRIQRGHLFHYYIQRGYIPINQEAINSPTQIKPEIINEEKNNQINK